MTALRIWRSPRSAFGVFREYRYENEFQYESFTANDAYSDQELADIAKAGFNAVWIHGRLDHLTSSAEFPEFGQNRAVHLQAIRQLIDRAGRHEIKVILYLQPPRAIYTEDTAFWEKHADVGGEVTEILDGRGARFNMRSLCTSHEKVRHYLREAFAQLTSSLPDLGGLMIISASEYPAHCYSRRNCRPGETRSFDQTLEQVPIHCPRCAAQTPETVILNLLHDIRDGVRQVSPELPIIFWNWCWSIYLVPAETAIIAGMPQDCILMCDFERGGQRIRPDGKIEKIEEYSLAYAGPSETFLKAFHQADQRKLVIMPKLQIGTTHELATVNSLPLPGSLFEKALFMRQHKIESFLGCWNFGNQVSANTEAFNFFLTPQAPKEKKEALEAFARLRFPGGNATLMREAWLEWEAAMRYYPFSVHFLYFSPLNYTLAYFSESGPLHLGPAGRSWLPDSRGDDFSESLHDTTLTETIDSLEKLAQMWQSGLNKFRQGGCNAADFQAELANATLCGAIFASAANTYKFFALKQHWHSDSLPRYRQICRAELAIIQAVKPLLPAIPAAGFHLEGRIHLFNAPLLDQKIQQLETVLQ